MKFFLTIFLVAACLAVFGQKGLVEKETSENGSVAFARFRLDSVPHSSDDAKKLLQELLKAKDEDDLKLEKRQKDDLGQEHQYFQQYYKGIRVEFGSYAVHSRNNVIETVNGNFHVLDRVDVNYQLSESDALNLAVEEIGAELYAWQKPEDEEWLNKNFGESYQPKGDLVILKGSKDPKNRYRVAWKFDIYALKPLSREYLYVDAISGAIIERYSVIHHVNATGTAATRYSGSKSIVTDSFTGGFRLRETRNSVNVQTLNMTGQGSGFGSATDFVDNNNSWTSAEFNNAAKDNAALDAHWGAEMVYDYFNNVHSRNSWNGTGGALLSYVHTNLTSFGLPDNDNAFWDGSRMVYGDGTTLFHPLTALDVCAHEIGHGVCSSSARLAYRSESGALNEGLSDVWAACVEQWAAPGKLTWRVGEDITKVSPYFLRSMNNPNTSMDPQPDTRTGTHWFNVSGCIPSSSNDFCGVHKNSGVINFWFYLLSQGGSGSNDLGQSYNVSGISLNSAARIVYRAETVVLPQPVSPAESDVTFDQFRTATITAATDLFCANSKEVAAVTNAWRAVGVGAAFSGTMPSITGTEPICSSQSFTVQNQIAGTSRNWWSSNTSQMTVSPTTNTTTTATRANSYNGAVNLNLTLTGTGGCSTVVTRAVQVGAFNTGQITVSGTVAVCPGNNYVYTANVPGGHQAGYSYQWTKPANWTVNYQGANTISLYVPTYNPDYGTVRVQVTNQCGTSAYTGVTVYPGCGGYYFSIYPNPASTDLTVEMLSEEDGLSTNADSLSSQEEIEFSVELTTDTGRKVQKGTSKDRKIKIDTRSYPKGLYILRLTYGKEIVTERILIE